MKSIIFFLLLFFVCKSSFAGFPQQKNEVIQNDQVTLFLDRSVYVAGDIISFTSFINNYNNDFKSNVLYLELITPSGRTVISQKHKISDNKSSGEILIPNDLLSGVFLVKAYTRWQRNFSPYSYSYTPIKILNENGILVNGTSSNGSEIKKDFVQIQALSNGIELNLCDTVYSARREEKATLKVNLPADFHSLNLLSLSIVPVGALYECYSLNSSYDENSFSFDYVPDYDGFILSGKVINTDSNIPSPFVPVGISILGEEPDFLMARTDSTGVFSFVLKENKGKKDLYISLGSSDTLNVKIDNDFCTRKIGFNVSLFNITPWDLTLADEFINNRKIAKHFSKDSLIFEDISLTIPSNPSPFYGTPDVTIDLSTYIDLLSVNEYFHELIPFVSIRRLQKGRSFFNIIGNDPELSIYEPLLLLDNIFVSDIERILEINPNQLLKIDIVTNPYYRGDMIYGGIISFYSKRNDFAGIQLPEKDMFVSYDFHSLLSNKNEVDYDENFPDTRNTIFWKADIDLKEQIFFEFYTPTKRGKYEVILRGLTNSNKIVFMKTCFTIM